VESGERLGAQWTLRGWLSVWRASFEGESRRRSPRVLLVSHARLTQASTARMDEAKVTCTRTEGDCQS
jgi:hypothetical protein